MSRNVYFFLVSFFPVFLMTPFGNLSCAAKSVKIVQFPSNFAHNKISSSISTFSDSFA